MHPNVLYWCGALYDTPWDSVTHITSLISSVMEGLPEDKANNQVYSKNNVPSPAWVSDVQAMLVTWMKNNNTKHTTRETLQTVVMFTLLWGRFDALCVMRKGMCSYPINTQQLLTCTVE